MGMDYVVLAPDKTEQDLKDGMLKLGFTIHRDPERPDAIDYAFVKNDGYLWFYGVCDGLFSFTAWGLNMFQPTKIYPHIEAIEKVLGSDVISEHDEEYHSLVFGDDEDSGEDTVH